MGYENKWDMDVAAESIKKKTECADLCPIIEEGRLEVVASIHQEAGGDWVIVPCHGFQVVQLPGGPVVHHTCDLGA